MTKTKYYGKIRVSKCYPVENGKQSQTTYIETGENLDELIRCAIEHRDSGSNKPFIINTFKAPKRTNEDGMYTTLLTNEVV